MLEKMFGVYAAIIRKAIFAKAMRRLFYNRYGGHPTLFPQAIYWGVLSQEKNGGNCLGGIPGACPPSVRHVSSSCPPLFRFGHVSKPCSPCVRHVTDLRQPCVRLESALFALCLPCVCLESAAAASPNFVRRLFASGLVSTLASPPNFVCHASAFPFVGHASASVFNHVPAFYPPLIRARVRLVSAICPPFCVCLECALAAPPNFVRHVSAMRRPCVCLASALRPPWVR